MQKYDYANAMMLQSFSQSEVASPKAMSANHIVQRYPLSAKSLRQLPHFNLPTHCRR
jgi:hypothetical protein